MESILVMTITNFLTQIAFIWVRTWNVKAVASNNLKQVLLSGAFTHIAWLFSISLSAYSMTQIMKNWEWEYLPVVMASLLGGAIGGYLGLKEKQKYRK